MNMKNVCIKVVICMAMLMASMNMMAQRETLKFAGEISGFPTGGSSPVMLTVDPYGKFELKVEGSKTVTAFTIKGKHNADLSYGQAGSNGETGLRTTGAIWAMQVAEWDAFRCNAKGGLEKGGTEFKSADGNIKGSMSGRTEEKYIRLNISLRASGPIPTLGLQCTLKKK